MFHSNDYFSSGVSFSIIPDSFSNLTKRVTSIDNRYDLAGFSANAFSGTATYSAKPPQPHPDRSPNTSSPG